MEHKVNAGFCVTASERFIQNEFQRWWAKHRCADNLNAVNKGAFKGVLLWSIISA
jgi:hypothetical protein